MSKQQIELISNSLQLDPNFAGSIDLLAFYICDTETDLPAPAWGRFAVVKEPDGNGRHYVYVGIGEGWKRAELELVGD